MTSDHPVGCDQSVVEGGTPMESRLEELRTKQKGQLRFMLFGSVAGCGVAYLLLIVAKLMGRLTHPIYNWWFIVLGPIIGYSLFLSTAWFACRCDLWLARREEERARQV
jgi:hypothetical protein